MSKKGFANLAIYPVEVKIRKRQEEETRSFLGNEKRTINNEEDDGLLLFKANEIFVTCKNGLTALETNTHTHT